MSHPSAQFAPSADSFQTVPSVSVVVPAYNCADRLHACLDSLFQQTYPRTRYDITLVDDGSTDETAARARALAQHWEGTLTVVQQPNGGPASARNAGIRASQGEVVAFIDADCVAAPDWLAQVVGVLVATEATGVGGPLLNVAPRTWVSRYLDAAAFYRHRVRKGQVDYLVTANVAFRRSALIALGGFAEREGAWCEDADLSFRLRQSGHRLLLSPGGTVTHYGSPATLRSLARELYRYGYGNFVLSPNWQNGRTPLMEITRHGGAVVLAPALALRFIRRVGLWRAASFWPLVVVEHAAFTVGLLSALGTHWRRGGREYAQALRNRYLAGTQ